MRCCLHASGGWGWDEGVVKGVEWVAQWVGGVAVLGSVDVLSLCELLMLTGTGLSLDTLHPHCHQLTYLPRAYPIPPPTHPRRRVLVLKTVCELRADRDDLRTLMEDAVNRKGGPGAALPASSSAAATSEGGGGGGEGGGGAGASSAGGVVSIRALAGGSGRSEGVMSRRARAASEQTPPPPSSISPEEVRGRAAFGSDAEGCAYYWFDMPVDQSYQVRGDGGGDWVTHSGV